MPRMCRIYRLLDVLVLPCVAAPASCPVYRMLAFEEASVTGVWDRGGLCKNTRLMDGGGTSMMSPLLAALVPPVWHSQPHRLTNTPKLPYQHAFHGKITPCRMRHPLLVSAEIAPIQRVMRGLYIT
jgi:hypothetical protein